VAVPLPLTVAAIRGSEEEDHVEVLFLESPRVYQLERARPNFDKLVSQLREGRRVRLTTVRPESDVILDMEILAE
jgi:hypothetical protein